MRANSCAVSGVANHDIVKSPCGKKIDAAPKRINLGKPFIDALDE